MESDLKKEIIKFSSSLLWQMIAGIIFIAAGLLMLIPIIITPLPERVVKIDLELDITLFVLGAILIIRSVLIKSRIRKTVEKIESMGGESTLRNDFYNGERLYNGQLILGSRFIIGKRNGDIVEYEDIKNVYQYVRKRNLIEVYRILKIIKENGKTVSLCSIPTMGMGDKDTNRAFEIMLTKNSRIKIGKK